MCLPFDRVLLLQPTVVELANFELFSSGPRDVRVSSSERYPTAEWTVLGELLAEDRRDVQRFVLANNRIYAKYIKVRPDAIGFRRGSCRGSCFFVL